MLFESSWKEEFTYYERVFDETTGKSIKRKISDKFEWFEEASNGLYEYVLDSEVKLRKVLGNAKDGRGNYGYIDPLYKNIRDEYWNKNLYNLNPRIWYFDIETRAGGYKYHNMKVKVRKKI